MTKFETYVTGLLANPRTAADDFEVAVSECQTQVAEEESEAIRLRAASLDPALAPDPRIALEKAQLAEIAVARCRALLPRLEQAWRTALANEYHEKWAARHQAARKARDAASVKFARVHDLQMELLAIFAEAEAADALVATANADAPAGESRRLLSTELHARGLEAYTRECVSLMRETRLIHFETGKQAWPIVQRLDPAVFAMDGRRFADDCSPDWWKRGAAEAEARQRRDADELARAAVERDRFYGKGAA